jgi:hypothetical protein
LLAPASTALAALHRMCTADPYGVFPMSDVNLTLSTRANLTSLQTAQSLGVVSLQISTQSQQSILRLF